MSKVLKKSGDFGTVSITISRGERESRGSFVARKLMPQTAGVIYIRVTRGPISIAGNIVYIKSGSIWYRKLIRDDLYCIDKSEDSGVTWELDLLTMNTDEDNIIISIDDGVAGHRHVVRGGAYCIDAEFTETGFDGDEDVDWEIGRAHV